MTQGREKERNRASKVFQMQSNTVKKIFQKLLEIEEEVVREVARGDKCYLKKQCRSQSMYQYGERNERHTLLFCALRSADSSGNCYAVSQTQTKESECEGRRAIEQRAGSYFIVDIVSRIADE